MKYTPKPLLYLPYSAIHLYMGKRQMVNQSAATNAWAEGLTAIRSEEGLVPSLEHGRQCLNNPE
jgi:hypothetical protein